MKTETISLLLYSLHYIDDIDSLVFNEEDIESFQERFSLEKRKKMLPELDYIMALYPSFNFKTMISETKYSNEDILAYLNKLHAFIRKYEDRIISA
ncbi:hypothetical protein [Pedobacter nototheniae]|uniref:hypothetical protein n=1 Tax=Pedobacter nototheniae TaxID=2488994 RepID=UPI00292DBB3D|nr:hypothetical protein [Pedobacter nototheniae]